MTRDLSAIEREIAKAVLGQVPEGENRDLLFRQLESAKVVDDLPGEAHLRVDRTLRSTAVNGPSVLMLGTDPDGHEVTVHLVLSGGLLAVLKIFSSLTGEFSDVPSVESLRPWTGGYFRI